MVAHICGLVCVCVVFGTVWHSRANSDLHALCCPATFPQCYNLATRGLDACGWVIQSCRDLNLYAARLRQAVLKAAFEGRLQ